MRADRFHRTHPNRRGFVVHTEDGHYVRDRRPARADDVRTAIRASEAVAR